MNEPKRATVILIQRGDPEMAGAIARGMLTGKAGHGEHGSPVWETGERGEHGSPLHEDDHAERIEIISAEADRDRFVAQLVRVAVGNTRTAEDYRLLITQARGLYGETRQPGLMSAVAGKLLLTWAMICQGFRRAYQAQDIVLKWHG